MVWMEGRVQDGFQIRGQTAGTRDAQTIIFDVTGIECHRIERRQVKFQCSYKYDFSGCVCGQSDLQGAMIV